MRDRGTMSGGLIGEALVMGGVESRVKEDGGHMVSTDVLCLDLPTPSRDGVEGATSEMDNAHVN